MGVCLESYVCRYGGEVLKKLMVRFHMIDESLRSLRNRENRKCEKGKELIHLWS